MSLRDEDFYSWCKKNAEVLRRGQMIDTDLDYLDLAEELDFMSASVEREVKNRLAIIIAHLLKIKFEPQRKSRSWLLTIDEQRDETKITIKKNPGIKHKLDRIYLEAYNSSKYIFQRDTLIDKKELPEECPYSLENLLDDNFYGFSD